MLRYLLDENMRGVLWRAIQRHNTRSKETLDVIRVGDPSDLPLGTSDADILLWAEREGRILISHDANTLSRHLAAHLRAGHHSSGIFIPRQQTRLSQVLAFLGEAAYTSDPADWNDHVEYIP
jgi:hypothetical protein